MLQFRGKNHGEVRNIILDGYWQSWLYIKDHISDIVRLFNHPWYYQNKISLHARFGDYRTIVGKHILVDEAYIISAINLLLDKTGRS